MTDKDSISKRYLEGEYQELLEQSKTLMSSSKLRDKVKALDTLESMVAIPSITRNHLFEVSFLLVDLLLWEASATENESTETSIILHLSVLKSIAQERNITSEMLDVLILQSRFAYVKGEWADAINELNEAMKIAKSDNLESYIVKIDKTLKEIEHSVQQWESLTELPPVDESIRGKIRRSHTLFVRGNKVMAMELLYEALKNAEETKQEAYVQMINRIIVSVKKYDRFESEI